MTIQSLDRHLTFALDKLSPELRRSSACRRAGEEMAGGSPGGTATNAPPTPSGTSFPCGAGACTTPLPPRPASCTSPGGPTPASCCPQARSRTAAGTRTPATSSHCRLIHTPRTIGPALEMTDPLPAQARRAVTSIGHGQVPGTVLQDLEIGVTEAIGHARRHGHPRHRADLGRIRADPGPRPRHLPGARRPAGRTGTRIGRSRIPRSRTLAHPHARPRHRTDPVQGRLYRRARRRARYLTARQCQHNACGHASNHTGTSRDPGDTDRATWRRAIPAS